MGDCLGTLGAAGNGVDTGAAPPPPPTLKFILQNLNKTGSAAIKPPSSFRASKTFFTGQSKVGVVVVVVVGGGGGGGGNKGAEKVSESFGRSVKKCNWLHFWCENFRNNLTMEKKKKQFDQKKTNSRSNEKNKKFPTYEEDEILVHKLFL